MRNIIFIICLSTFYLPFSTAIAADKVVVIPLGNQRSGGVNSDQICPGLNSYMIGIAGDGTIICGPKLVFVTSTTHNGNLGGLVGADTTCNTLATAAGLPGLYKAWISTASGSPATRTDFTKIEGKYILVDRVTVVADNWTDLTDGTLTHAINMTETGTPNVVAAVWTQTSTTGHHIATGGSETGCNNFTFADDQGGASEGYTAETSSAWTDDEGITPGVDYWCNSIARLYCFQQ